MRRQMLVVLAVLVWIGVFLAGPVAAAAPDLRFTVTGRGLPEGVTEIGKVNGLNNLGDVVGSGHIPYYLSYKEVAILWDNYHDTGTLLPLLSGCDQSRAYAINDSVQVVGYCFNPSTNAYQACLWQNGAVQALAPPTDIGPVTGSIAYGINNEGQVVGTAKKFVSTDTWFAFLWNPALGLMNLNDLLIPSQPDWNLTEASGINGNMQIIGTGEYQGINHGFLLDRVGTSATEAVNFLLLLQN